MHFQQLFAISSLLLTGVLSAPVADLETRANGIKNAADNAYEFKVAFKDASKFVTNPAWAQLLKDPAVKSNILKNNPGLTIPTIEGLHPKRDIKNAADAAYEFKVKFRDASTFATNPAWAQLLKDPAVKSTILKNNPGLTIPTIKGLNPKREEIEAAEEE